MIIPDISGHCSNWDSPLTSAPGSWTLTNRPQSVRMGPHLSSAIALNNVLSPLLYSLYTYDNTPCYTTKSTIKFADDTTVVGLISGGDECVQRDEVHKLTLWCSANNLTLNTKELILDFRKCRVGHPPIFTHIIDNLSWSTNITVAVKKAKQRLHFLRVPQKNNLDCRLLVFYRSAIETELLY